jgi:NTP pyrophosphatase (non-canonical NTP hydrolase)
MSILHAAIGINTEAGELLDAIKKAFIYGQTINVENVIEELGDLEFYIQMIRNAMQINRGEVLEANVKKLELRYPLKYTDECAKERADKQGSEK